MGWTYDGDPQGDRKDEVRFLVGDTDDAEHLVSDEEIEFVLSQFPPADTKPAWLAGAHIADGIAAKFARKADRTLGSLQMSAKQQRDHYVELAQSLRTLYATNGLGVVGGTMAGVKPAIPVLSGGGRTYLGSSTYMDRGDS